MRSFADIHALAAARKGGMAALEALLATTPSRPPAEIAALADDRILAAMTRRIFAAGFSIKVIDGKWPAFEAAFDGFDPGRCALMSDDKFDALLKDAGIVRNGAKIRAVQVNAQLLRDLAAESGSAARAFADWPDGDYIGLLDLLKKRGAHLGGDSAMRFLRDIGKPAFIPTPDVVTALIREGVIAKAPGGKKDFAAVQAAFNRWSEESGRDLTAISRTLAMTVGD
ncbi:DNA-3-methyladenine glycosylase I [Zavarzinia aquatilis]|uniref:3-methyladenine DNA glycosylase n=1 Tax=Zavarzinia aquatilis TaxID=2211142 RepID=A0A317E1W0_9PROT|nr:DNA-3-methyladenine glycosylase I [Zavarzinia aquatilis]PWR19353.1 3-methyladenine DNA glycosylase [Zavarzinia aquatilis]